MDCHCPCLWHKHICWVFYYVGHFTEGLKIKCWQHSAMSGNFWLLIKISHLFFPWEKLLRFEGHCTSTYIHIHNTHSKYAIWIFISAYICIQQQTEPVAFSIYKVTKLYLLVAKVLLVVQESLYCTYLDLLYWSKITTIYISLEITKHPLTVSHTEI